MTISVNFAKLRGLRTVAEAFGYRVEHVPTHRVRGWPVDSAKPFHVKSASGAHMGSFATLDAVARYFETRSAW